MIGSQDYLGVWAVPRVQHDIVQGLFNDPFAGTSNPWAVPGVQSVPVKNSFTEIFFEMKNVQTKHCRKFYSPLSKISLHHETVIYNRLIVFHKLFSWNSVGPSKYSINKIIGSQGHLNIWAVSRVQHEIIQRLFQS